MDCRTALLTLLDQVDYTAGNCRPNEMVGAVLPAEVIRLCREAAQHSVQADGWTCPHCDCYAVGDVECEWCGESKPAAANE